MNRSHDIRASLSRGSRNWQFIALPVTLLVTIALLTLGTGQPFAPTTSALRAAPLDTPLVSNTTANTVTLLYSDPGRGEISTLQLPTGQVAHSDLKP